MTTWIVSFTVNGRPFEIRRPYCPHARIPPRLREEVERRYGRLEAVTSYDIQSVGAPKFIDWDDED